MSFPFRIENVITDSDCIKLISAQGDEFKIILEGDCCSSSFFDDNSVLDAKSLLGEHFLGFEDVAIPSGEEPPDNEHAEATIHYCLVLRTDKSSISLFWRNESNGYYSGYSKQYFNDTPVGRGYGDSLDGKLIAMYLRGEMPEVEAARRVEHGPERAPLEIPGQRISLNDIFKRLYGPGNFQ